MHEVPPVAAASIDWVPGGPLGVLIGVISGVVFTTIISAIPGLRSIGSILKVTPQILAIPTFWFGGPWLSTKLMKDLKAEQIADAYVTCLAVTFLLVAAWPLIRLNILQGNRIGRA
jgi:hypothetical protein